MYATLFARPALRSSRCWAKLHVAGGWEGMLALLHGQRHAAKLDELVEHRRVGLDGSASMVEKQSPQAAQLLASAGASGPAVHRVRHDVAVTGMRLCDRWRDDVDPPGAVGELQRGCGQRAGVRAVERRDQRPSAQT